VYPQATVAAEDALEAHKLLKSREDSMDAELAAANSKAEQLSAELAAAQQQAAEAQQRALEAEEQSKQVRAG
jgi:prefoldin subunit 5